MSRKKTTIPKNLKQLALDRGYVLTRANFVKMKNFLGELTPGESRSLALLIITKEDPVKAEMLLALTCLKLEKEKEKIIGGFNESNLLVKKQVDIGNTISNMFN